MTNTFISDLSGKEFPESEKMSARLINKSVLNEIHKDKPDFNASNYLSTSEFKKYKAKSLMDYFSIKSKKISKAHQTVIDAVTDNSLISEIVEEQEKNQEITFGQKVADKVAEFGGSWTFIISFGTFLVLWISLNAFWLVNKGFDPYPFILLNLILSCIAAIQAPIIMMSQNRQESKDRDRAKNDYMINLKSELEIRSLNEKLDHLVTLHQQELSDLKSDMEEVLRNVDKRK